MNKKLFLAVFLLSSGLLFFNPCFSYEQLQPGQDGYINGRIVYVDPIRSTVTVQFMQADSDSDEITFAVTQHTRINRGDLLLSILDLDIGSQVKVQFHDNPISFTYLEADSISVS
jgi:hypothetical protein